MFSCHSLKILEVSDNKLEIVLMFIDNYYAYNFLFKGSIPLCQDF